MDTNDSPARAEAAADEPALDTEVPTWAPREDRRNPDVPDRRATPRGGRRTTDALRQVAEFAYRLLTEPPR